MNYNKEAKSFNFYEGFRSQPREYTSSHNKGPSMVEGMFPTGFGVSGSPLSETKP